MYAGLADVTFFQNSMHLPIDQYIVYFNVGVEITLSEFEPGLVHLEFDAELVGVDGATSVRVRLPNGLEHEGEITPWAATRGATSIMFNLQTPVTLPLHE